ncbi:MAG: hypothetical protein M0036_04745 [Desulfobacteraceae bacterium]|nr:hypothetical protein [Desulfobacteraceae bacterium]
MQVVAIGRRKPSGLDDFFSVDLNYFLKELRCICAIHTAESAVLPQGIQHAFSVHLTYGLEVQFAFESAAQAYAEKKALVAKALAFFGQDQLLLCDGIAGDVVLLSAIMDMTEIFEKDRQASFALTLADVRLPVHLVFNSILEAEAYYKAISRRLETMRQDRYRVQESA